MNHADAVREMAVERYLLGELSGEALNGFEEHFFECRECANELKAGMMFVDGAKLELRAPVRIGVARVEEKRSWVGWLATPWALGPALAACLLVIAAQALVVLPRMKQELTVAETPAVLNNLVLASAGARGDGVAEVTAPLHGAFLLSVDIPARSGFASYECLLYSPTGALVWKTMVSAQQASDAVLIHMPTDTTAAGLNTVIVQGVTDGAGSDGKLVDLARYKFELKVVK